MKQLFIQDILEANERKNNFLKLKVLTKSIGLTRPVKKLDLNRLKSL